MMLNELDKMVNIGDITKTLEDLREDMTVPKNIRTKIEETIEILKEDTKLSIKINKALNYLDEIASDVNLQSYTRTQIWNLISIFEKLEHPSE